MTEHPEKRGVAQLLRKVGRAVGGAISLSIGLAAIAWICVALFYSFTYDEDAEYVKDYCSYGAVSQAQLDHCIATVSRLVVDGYADGLTRKPTNAGRYAYGTLDRCIRDPYDDQVDAGPFCKPR
jgi:hypothetical protein